MTLKLAIYPIELVARIKRLEHDLERLITEGIDALMSKEQLMPSTALSGFGCMGQFRLAFISITLTTIGKITASKIFA
jgi:hypothetical protein